MIFIHLKYIFESEKFTGKKVILHINVCLYESAVNLWQSAVFIIYIPMKPLFLQLMFVLLNPSFAKFDLFLNIMGVTMTYKLLSNFSKTLIVKYIIVLS